jgi:hypothetical protein
MTTTIKHIVSRSQKVLKDMSYAQKRASELQTGVVITRRAR